MHTTTLFLKQKDLCFYVYDDGDLEIFLVAIVKILKAACVFIV